MTTYTPTDEQIEAYAKHSVGHDWVFFDERMRGWESDKARREISSPAFQAIIRAAQAEAWRDGVEAGYAVDSSDNPYIEATQ